MATQRHHRHTACCLSVATIGAVALTLLVVIQAQPQEKIASHSIHYHSRKRAHIWSRQQLHNVLQNIDWASNQQHSSPSWSTAVISPLPAFLDSTKLSPNAKSSSSTNSPLSRFQGGQWKFVLAPNSANVTTESTSTSVVLDKRTVSQQQQQQQNQRQVSSRSYLHNSPWQRLKDDFNFKGYGISLYKSLMAWNKAGIAFRVPLLNHWDWWDSNPALPSIGLMFCVYYPFNLSMCMTSSMRMDILKCWFAKSLWFMQACLLQFLHHVVSAVWTIASALMYPLHQKWYSVPFQLDQRAANATAKSQEITATSQSDIQERLGMSYWYRWTPAVGFDSRISVWHMYMPTLEVYSQLLTGSKEKLFGPWWKSHFALLGLDSAVSKGMFFGTGVLSLSGLRFKRRRSSSSKNKKADRQRETETIDVPTISVNKDKVPSRSEVDAKTTKETLSTILQEERNKYEDDENVSSTRIKVMRGGNNNNSTTTTNVTTPTS
jgi:hypothetical protein